MPGRGQTPPYSLKSLRRLEMDLLSETLKRIGPLNEEFAVNAQKHLDNLTKPPSSLGRLEEFARRLVTITENKSPLLDKKVIFTFAGDHGITAEGVSAYPKEVTPQMVFNFSARRSWHKCSRETRRRRGSRCRYWCRLRFRRCQGACKHEGH